MRIEFTGQRIEDPLELEEIVLWLRAKGSALKHSNVSLAEVRESSENVPNAAADFDAANAIGRISIWVSGLFDFEVLHRIDGEHVFFRHVEASSMNLPNVESAYEDFLKNMLSPRRTI